jgi:Protein of unknown function (DUF3025)
MHGLLRAIDWRQPWFTPYRELGAAVTAQVAGGASLVEALNSQRGVHTPRFVVPEDPGGEAYEAFVARTACVPTRDNLHDFFNALVWLRLPALKSRMNRMHAAHIERLGVAGQRGAVRDRLTLIDESGALLAAPPALAHALHERAWTDLFVAQRDAWRDARFEVVGHALLEKLVRPRKALTAHVWLGDAAGDPMSIALGEAPFAPLPVLGIPGWWPANANPGFYADALVFRPR